MENQVNSPLASPVIFEPSSIAETVLREGFARYESRLQQAGIPSPLSPGGNPILDFGTSYSQLLVLCFFDSGRQSLSSQAYETLSFDPDVLKQAWEDFKAFMRQGGSEATAECRLGPYSSTAELVYFDDKSALSFSQLNQGLPLVEIYNWQAGSWDLSELSEKRDWISGVEERLQVLGYQQERRIIQQRSFEFYTHPDPIMATLLVDWTGENELHVLVFYQSCPGQRIVLKKDELAVLQTPVVDLWAKPQTIGLYDAKTGSQPV